MNDSASTNHQPGQAPSLTCDDFDHWLASAKPESVLCYARAVWLVRAKVENRAPEVQIASDGKPAPQVINIMAALKESMQKQGQTKVRDAVGKRMGKAPTKEAMPRPTSRSRARRSAH